MEDQTCDYLVIGGGVAGCIIARRLADGQSGRVILLEAGPSDEGDRAATHLAHLDEQTAAYEWGFKAAPLAGGASEMHYSRAKILGGCANHNDCAFLIPPDSDFAHWERLGAKGWGRDGVRPFFARVDSMVAADTNAPRNPISEAFVQAGREMGLADIAFRERIAPGVGWFPLNIKGPLRQSTSAAYLHPIASLPANLDIQTGTFAERLLFKGKRCVGAITDRGTIHARREVILTAGALQSPQLLLLSGLGPAEDLRQLDIQVRADLPGVGAHLLDHVAAPVIWDLHNPVPDWKLTPFEAMMMIQIDALAPAPDALFHFGLRVREKYDLNPRQKTVTNGVKVSPNVARARSQGSLRLASPDPRSAPIINLNYFSDPDGYDQRILLAAMKFARRMIATPALDHLIRAEVAPGPDVVSDRQLMRYIKTVCETVYHPSGTCLMGDPGNPRTVVGSDLKVRGVEALRVADASVFPSMITVNIANTVMMVAEKAADAILADAA